MYFLLSFVYSLEGGDLVKTLHIISYSLIVLGALNWGLVGLLDLNLVEALLGSWSGLFRLIYILIGVAALYGLSKHRGECKCCSGEMK